MKCTLQRSIGETIETIANRVREMHFTVRMRTHMQEPKSTETAPPVSAIELIAERVAGNLF